MKHFFMTVGIVVSVTALCLLANYIEYHRLEYSIANSLMVAFITLCIINNLDNQTK